MIFTWPLLLPTYLAVHDVVLASSLSTQGTVVDVGYARYLGNRSFSNTNAFLGIPYAEPPLGERRFRAPLPLNTSRITQASNGSVVDATEYPDFCVQGSMGDGDAGGAGSEDCLKVNIYAPVGAKQGSNLPVLVYIHGGGYAFGNPSTLPFDHWIHQSPNVIIASIYYRLASFGFLAVPEFSDPTNGDFNVGFQDQIQALKWIQQNIDAFGGDPKQVTIDGQSAGASSVELHLVTNEGGQLFSRAIAQSVFRAPVPTVEEQAPLFAIYAGEAGCGTGSISAQLDCLRTASVSDLARAQDAGSLAALTGPFNQFIPVIDGKLITDFPTRSVVSGNFTHVPLLVGSTSNETLSLNGTTSAALKRFFPQLNDTDINEFLKVYPLADFKSEFQRMQVTTGESELRCAREIMGAAFSEHTTTWTYRYNQPNPTIPGPLGLEVGHGAENWMMFLGTNPGFNGSTAFTQMTPVEISFSEELIAYWLSFVRAGNPNTFRLPRSPAWPQYIGANKTRVVLQQDPLNWTNSSGNFLEREPERERERCRFVVSKVAHEQN